MRPRAIAPWLAALTLTAVATAVRPAVAQDPVPEATPTPTAAVTSSAVGDKPASAPDPCSIRPQPGEAWIDLTRARLYRSVCASARWFDGFFGDIRFDQETSATYGRAGLGLTWSEYDSGTAITDFFARYPLPNLSHKLDVVLARDNEDDFVQDRTSPNYAVSEFVSSTQDQSWLAGLGYTPFSTNRSRLRFSGGLRLSWPPVPYVQARYRYRYFFSDQLALRAQETVFWRRDDGFGTTTVVDLERLLGAHALARWSTSATLSQATEGARVNSSLTLYQSLGGARALAYSALIKSESGAPVPIERWGARVVYRQRAWRDWLFAEIGTGVSWPRGTLEERRSASWGFGLRFEIFFGQWPGDRMPSTTLPPPGG
jgi:hypothetical protein